MPETKMRSVPLKGSKGSTNADEQLTELRQDGLPSLDTLKINTQQEI